MYPEQTLTQQIIGAAIEVHKAIGPGLLESAYQACLAQELRLRNVAFETEKPLPIMYKGAKLDCGYRLDFLIEGRVVVEIKSIETLLPIHEAQILTYLRLTQCKIGLLINFNVPVLKNGIKRIIL
ncbi:GxxExxY protein [Kouleothrix aurantiaca]|jgi:GxxExxY protein|uniref:GxxExxY protein n=1 Tax=Kouleothrix aurantiaca TaxID=186479 RepID=A0A0N8PSQ5_9CHLR|nr:GxxExxY protein [Kouleothrix aurantiaca]